MMCGATDPSQQIIKYPPPGGAFCGLVYDKELVATARRHCRPFQGWRYLDPKDAPADARDLKGGKNMPEKLKAELADLGLL